MPLPLLFIIPAVATGAVGAGKTVKSVVDSSQAKSITQDANDRVEAAVTAANRSRKACGEALARLGEEKIVVLNGSIHTFLEEFEKLKNVDFTDSAGLEELRKLRIDRESLEELRELSDYAAAVAKGSAAGVAGGALTAFGAYNAAMALGTASTGTAISTLSGIAAKNATLAFFGGGSLASGGLGMAGGVAVLSSMVAGPALLAMGLITGAQADKSLNIAKENAAKADETEAQLKTAEFQSDAIRRRTYMFYALLARLDTRFLPMIHRMQEIIRTEGVDYRRLSRESRQTIQQAATLAGSVKAVLDTPILTEDGALTEESAKLAAHAQELIASGKTAR